MKAIQNIIINCSYLIAAFKFTIIITFLLYCVISQMYESISDIFQIKILATSSQITLIIPISLEITIHCCYECKTSYIKFSIFVKKRLLNVFLNYIRSFLAIYICVGDDFFNLLQFSADLNATTSISVFTWFYYPYCLTQLIEISILTIIITLENFLEFLKFLVIRTFLNMKSQW